MASDIAATVPEWSAPNGDTAMTKKPLYFAAFALLVFIVPAYSAPVAEIPSSCECVTCFLAGNGCGGSKPNGGRAIPDKTTPTKGSRKGGKSGAGMQ
jgi:hypothetical protein